MVTCTSVQVAIAAKLYIAGLHMSQSVQILKFALTARVVASYILTITEFSITSN